MRFLIDSDVLIDFLEGQRQVVSKMQELLFAGAALSVISAMEVLDGVKFGRDPDVARSNFDRFAHSVTLLDVDLAIAERAATIRGQLRQAGKRPRIGRWTSS
jgi:predicted nucleic acid-binding protein